jgi:glycosylphosphatidylinositol transamidase (GPIT) subunit GPI8
MNIQDFANESTEKLLNSESPGSMLVGALLRKMIPVCATWVFIALKHPDVADTTIVMNAMEKALTSIIMMMIGTMFLNADDGKAYNAEGVEIDIVNAIKANAEVLCDRIKEKINGLDKPDVIMSIVG